MMTGRAGPKSTNRFFAGPAGLPFADFFNPRRDFQDRRATHTGARFWNVESVQWLRRDEVASNGQK